MDDLLFVCLIVIGIFIVFWILVWYVTTLDPHPRESSFDTPESINKAINDSLKQTNSIKITDMAGMDSIATGLGAPAKITVEGRAGDDFGAENHGATIRMRGDAGECVGREMHSGSIDVTGNSGDHTGMKMQDGFLIVKGKCGTHTGEGMSGGTIIVGGACGVETGKGMTGGKIIARIFLGLGRNAVEFPLSEEELSLVKEHLEIKKFEDIKYRKVVPRNPASPPPPGPMTDE